MNKEINKLLLPIVKYDLVSGLFITLIIWIISTFTNAGSYLAGMCVATTNFFVSGYIIAKYIEKNEKQYFVFASYFFRFGFIVISMLPFVKDNNLIVCYTVGFISHYIVLIVFSIKNRKGSV